MTVLATQKLQLIHEFFKIKVIKFGEFKLKSGINSPVYIDLRQLISHPQLLRAAATLLWQSCQRLSFDLLCGIPYTALPIATCLSLQENIPMIMRRKEKKAYGTQQQIEGSYQAGQTCLIIEDVITSGNSVVETLNDLRENNIIVRDVAVLIDREQGGLANLQQQNLKVHAALTLTEIFTGLFQQNLLTESEQSLINNFLLQPS
ncbi:MAG: orotate phosphoribosyltransferase [Pseudomonadota bacterium]